MTYPVKDYKKFYLPVYLIWAFLSPTLLLLSDNVYRVNVWDILLGNATKFQMQRILSFYAIFGMVWPLMIVIFPAFYTQIAAGNAVGGIFGDGNIVGGLILWLIATLGPIIMFVVMVYLHKVAKEKELKKSLKWSEFFLGFI